MALILKKKFNSGFEAEYFTLQHLTINKEAGNVLACFSLYKDKATRNLDGSMPIDRITVVIPFDAVKNTKDDVNFAAAYGACKVLPEFAGAIDG